MDYSLTPDTLRQHGLFVRTLARALLRDADAAEDVAQEALTRLVVQPPRDMDRPRGWLATVVRRLASNRRRADERRARHEERVPPKDGGRTPAEENEQAEQVARVIAAVLALEPAQRDTIMARYFRGLSARELAEESHTSEDTVRARERRALEKLRTRLDRESGSRAAWAAGLARLVARPEVGPPPITGPAATLTPLAGLAAAGALALVVTAIVWRGLAGGEAEGEASVARASDPSGIAAQQGAELAPPTPPARETNDAARVPVPSAAAAAHPPGDSGAPAPSAAFQSEELVELRGRLLLADGAPAAGVPWQISGWAGNEELTLLFGEPEEWVDPQGTTEADGSFVIAFAPPRAYQFTLDAKAPGHAAVSWRWDALAPGAVLELGTLTLARGATVEGRLVDASGAPVLGQEWLVYLDSVGLAERNGRDDISVRAPVDPTTGAFRAEDVMPGANELKAYSRMANWIRGVRVNAPAGETLTADLVYNGPDNSRRITLVTFCRPLYVLERPEPEHVALITPGGERRSAAKIPGSSQSYSFDQLEPGLYTLEIDDPRYVPWSQGGIAPGSSVSARLQPSAGATLTVLDLAGEPLEHYSVTVEFRGVSFWPREIAVHDGATPLAGGLVRLYPGDYTLHVRSGALASEVEVLGLVAGETRPVTVAFAQRSVIAGRLLEAGAEPAGGAEVLLLEPARSQDSEASPILRSGSMASDAERYRRQLAATISAADGSFEFALARGGSYVVHADVAGRTVSTPALALEDEQSRTGLVLSLPRGGSVAGTVRGPGGAPCSGLDLWIGREPVFPGLERDLVRRPLGPDGRFALTGLPAGTLGAWLLLPEDARPRGVDSSSIGWDRLELGTLGLAEGETLTHDFELLELPGSFTLEVLVNGQPSPGVSLHFARPDQAQWFLTRTDGQGRIGPARLFAGTWEVTAADAQAGWRSSPTLLHVPSAGTASATIPVELAEGWLRFLDASGNALAGRSISVFAESASEPGSGAWGTTSAHRTDGEGRARFTLCADRYLFRLDGEVALPFLRPEDVTVPVLWTSQGPAVSDIRF